jgi:hypothetical protein
MESVVVSARAVIMAGMGSAAVSMAMDRDFTQARAEREVHAIYRAASQRPMFVKDVAAQLLAEAIGAFAESEGFTGDRRVGFVRAWLGWPVGSCGSSDTGIGWEAGFSHPAKPLTATLQWIES